MGLGLLVGTGGEGVVASSFLSNFFYDFGRFDWLVAVHMSLVEVFNTASDVDFAELFNLRVECVYL